MDACVFCRLIRGEDDAAIILYEDERSVAFAPLKPATRGHTLVVSKTHVARIWDLAEEDATAVMSTVVMLSGSIRQALRPEGLNVIQSNGASATQTVDHVHVHLVPRWRRDKLLLRWPRLAAQSQNQQRDTAVAIRDELDSIDTTTVPACNSPEDRRQHLNFIQNVISRMASASASAKTWLLPIVAAAYGYAFVEESWLVALLGILAVGVFGLLDANYLKQERSFRGLYDQVARGGNVPAFSMNPTVAGPAKRARINYWPDLEDWRSWSIAPFYLPLLLVGVGLAADILWSC